jgi:hypothetical protein
LCSYSRTSQHVMEPEGSLPCSQQPSTCLYPKSDQSNPCRLIPTLWDTKTNSVAWVRERISANCCGQRGVA